MVWIREEMRVRAQRNSTMRGRGRPRLRFIDTIRRDKRANAMEEKDA